MENNYLGGGRPVEERVQERIMEENVIQGTYMPVLKGHNEA